MKSAAAPHPFLGNAEVSSFRHAMADVWRVVTTDLLRSYHPEKYYMRGPGPKWRERHPAGEIPVRGTIELDEFCSASRSAGR